MKTYSCAASPAGGHGPSQPSTPPLERAVTAPAGVTPDASSVVVGGKPATTQWTNPSASRSVTAIASSAAASGTPLMTSGGETSRPSHVKSSSSTSPRSNDGLERTMTPPAVESSVVKPGSGAAGAVVEVVSGEIGTSGAGSRVRPSWRQAEAASATSTTRATRNRRSTPAWCQSCRPSTRTPACATRRPPAGRRWRRPPAAACSRWRRRRTGSPRRPGGACRPARR